MSICRASISAPPEFENPPLEKKRRFDDIPQPDEHISEVERECKLLKNDLADAHAKLHRRESLPAPEALLDFEKVDVAIIGGGAVGTYLCLRLRAAGLSVALKHRENRSPAADVLALLQPAGVSLLDTWASMPYAEAIFVTTKTFDHEQVYAAVRMLKRPPKYLVAVHNGIMPDPASLPATTTLIRYASPL